MSGQTAQFVLAVAYAVPTLVWAIVALDLIRFLIKRRPRSRISHLLPILTALMTFVYAVSTGFALVPAWWHQLPSFGMIMFYWASDLAIVLSLALFRHVTFFLPVNERPPSRTWLAINYGCALAAWAVLDFVPVLLPEFGTVQGRNEIRIVFISYVVAVLGLGLLHVRRFARAGSWRPGGLGEARFADVITLGTGVLALAVLLFYSLQSVGWEWTNRGWSVLFNGVVGMLLVLPFAARVLGEVVRRFLFAAVMLTLTATVYLGLQSARTVALPEVRPLIDGIAVVLLFVVLVGGTAWLRPAIDQLVLRRSHHQRRNLQAYVHMLSPELGVDECCRRMLAEVVSEMRLRGGAVLFDDRRPSIVAGAMVIAPLERVWPRGSAASNLPTWGFGPGMFRELPGELKEALIDSEVVGVVPIISPRRRWGYAFVSATALTASFSDEDIQAMQTCVEQFALVLDGADLLARTVAVERSLAHAEKLATIGELAARIAHEIRNPVTAARSLTQQLCAERGEPFQAEHELILAELERIERQVAALLRFARREEFHFAPVDVAALARTTVEQFRGRLEARGIDARVEANGGVTARADQEKMRQVLINLIENAIDALDDLPGERRLTVAVSATNGTATIQVGDNGLGVAPDVLPRLFEPFFSLKSGGTGLGLAIVKRTIDAHSGQISATTDVGAGMVFRIELPLVPMSSAP